MQKVGFNAAEDTLFYHTLANGEEVKVIDYAKSLHQAIAVQLWDARDIHMRFYFVATSRL